MFIISGKSEGTRPPLLISSCVMLTYMDAMVCDSRVMLVYTRVLVGDSHVMVSDSHVMFVYSRVMVIYTDGMPVYSHVMVSDSHVLLVYTRVKVGDRGVFYSKGSNEGPDAHDLSASLPNQAI